MISRVSDVRRADIRGFGTAVDDGPCVRNASNDRGSSTVPAGLIDRQERSRTPIADTCGPLADLIADRPDRSRTQIEGTCAPLAEIHSGRGHRLDRSRTGSPTLIRPGEDSVDHLGMNNVLSFSRWLPPA